MPLSAARTSTSARLHGSSTAALHTRDARAIGLVAMVMHGDNVAARCARSRMTVHVLASRDA